MKPFRLSRPCYDKPHRCPGWAGGGMKYARTDRCENGSMRARPTRRQRALIETGDEDVAARIDSDRYPGHRPWRFSFCKKCNTVALPFALRRLDPTWILSTARSRGRRLLDDLRWRYERD